MSSSAIAGVITNLLAACRADTNLSAVRIFDGLEIDESYPGDAIAIGHDGSFEGDEIVAGSATQEYGPLGARNKMEDGQIACVLWTWDGLTDVTVRRARALTILGYLEALIRNNVSLDGACLYAGLDTFAMRYRQTTSGAAVVVPFTITYRARI